MAYEEIIDMGYSQVERIQRSQYFVERGIAQIYPNKEELAVELSGDRRLTAYMGIDPTAPDMHIGHESQLLKLREIQQLGHRVVLLIGDFTGMIGDPTDKSAGRIRQTREQVLNNAEGYRQQSSRILDFTHPTNPIELKYNSEWLGKMNFADVLELASNFTVQQMLERDMFEKRMAEGKPLNLTELLYPIMQGWDSVSMVPDGVDIEVGGSDQIFNMLTGGTLIRRVFSKQKYVVAGSLLVDPSGKKIGKTEGNMITMNDSPQVIFEKVMRFGDAIVPHALELCTSVPMDEIKVIEESIKSGELGGIEAKKLLARKIIEELNGEGAADDAAKLYSIISSNDSHSKIDLQTITGVSVTTGTSAVELLVSSGLANSKSAARRLLQGGAVRINDAKIDETFIVNKELSGAVLQVGKKNASNFRGISVTEH